MSVFSSSHLQPGEFYCYVKKGESVDEKLAKKADKSELGTLVESTPLSFDLNAGKTIWGHTKDSNVVAGNEGTMSGHHSTSYITVSGYEKIKFLGLVYKNNLTNLDTGYCFYDSNEDAITSSAKVWDKTLPADTNAIPKEYEVSVPENAMYFRCETRDSDTTLNFYCKGLKVVDSSDYTDEINNKIESISKNDQKTRIVQNLKDVKYGTSHCFTLLHFSDIHGDTIALQRIVSFKNSVSSYIDDVIHTGDSVWKQWPNGMDFWDSVDGSEYIMNVLGNHDTTNDGGYTWGQKTAAECRARYITPYLSNWGDVVIGSDVCYYYKDYTAYNIRLVVIDIYHWDNTQLAWLESTLEAARTATTPMHVIVAGHSPEATWGSHLDTPFDTLTLPNGREMDSRLPCISSDAISAISDFITAGGKFVCYMCGHTHIDAMRKFKDHDNMLSVTLQNASVIDHIAGATSQTGPNSGTKRVVGELSEDAFNIICINTDQSVLTILRVGQESDRMGRHVGSVTYDYANNKIVSQW